MYVCTTEVIGNNNTYIHFVIQFTKTGVNQELT